MLARRLQQPILTTTLVVLIFVQPLALTALHMIRPIEEEETKPLLAYYQSNARPGDVLYIYHSGVNAVKYYETIGFVRSPQRVWLLFSHMLNKEDLYTRELVAAFKDSAYAQTTTGAALYLFE